MVQGHRNEGVAKHNGPEPGAGIREAVGETSVALMCTGMVLKHPSVNTQV